MYQGDQEKWFCPDYIADEMDATFLDPHTDNPGAWKTPYVLSVQVGLAWRNPTPSLVVTAPTPHTDRFAMT